MPDGPSRPWELSEPTLRHEQIRASLLTNLEGRQCAHDQGDRQPLGPGRRRPLKCQPTMGSNSASRPSERDGGADDYGNAERVVLPRQTQIAQHGVPACATFLFAQSWISYLLWKIGYFWFASKARGNNAPRIPTMKHSISVAAIIPTRRPRRPSRSAETRRVGNQQASPEGRKHLGVLDTRSLSLACGTGLALAFDPIGWGLLAPLSLAFFFVRVRHLASVRMAALDGMLFGTAFLGVHMWWLVDSIGGVAWVALTLVESLWFALGYAAVYWCRGQALWPFATAAIWTAAELSPWQSWPFGGLPWGQLGVAALDTPFEAALPYLGVTGTSLLVALAAATGAHLAAGRSTMAWAGAGLAASVALIALAPYPVLEAQSGSGTSLQDQAAEPRVIALVQGGVPGNGRDVLAYRAQILASNLALTRNLAQDKAASGLGRPDLVIWAEGAAGSSPASDPAVREEITAAAREVGAPILVGSINAGPTTQTRYNQGVVWSGSGPEPMTYTKMHPVPFGEFIPGRSLLGGLSSQFDRIPLDMVPGPSPEPMRIGDLSIANAICFDIAYPGAIRDQVVAGAELLVVQTSNATFAGTSQPQQQFAISRARAIETQRTVVVASLNGITGAIGPDGAVMEQLSPAAVAIAMVTVTPSSHLTPAIRLGPLVPGAILIAAVLALLVEIAGRARRRGGGRAVTIDRTLP